MRLSHTLHNLKTHRILHPEFALFELSVWIHAFARSLIVIFIPIVLLQLSFSISEILVYYLLYMIFDVPLNFVARWLVTKIGARNSIIVGSIASILFFVSFSLLAAGNWPLLIGIALLAAIYDSAYWVAHLYLFMMCSTHDDNVSKDTSKLYIVRRLAEIVAPLIGGSILIFLNHQVLVAVTSSILLISIIPLFKIKNLKDKPKKKPLSAWSFFKTWSDVKEYVYRSLYAVHLETEGVLWPLFIFIIFLRIDYIAYLPVIVSITAAIFTYYIGSVQKDKRSALIIAGSSLIAFTWALRLIVDSAPWYYVSVFIVGLFSILISIPLDSSIFEKGEKRDALNASMYRNTFGMAARGVLYAALLILLNFFQASFMIAMLSMVALVCIVLAGRYWKGAEGSYPHGLRE